MLDFSTVVIKLTGSVLALDCMARVAHTFYAFAPSVGTQKPAWISQFNTCEMYAISHSDTCTSQL